MCCLRLAANTGRKKVAKNRHLGTIWQLCRAIFSQLRHVSTIGKKLLSINISSTFPHNMVNFGPLAAEIVSLVWGTPGNFNGFRVFAALLHGTLVVGVSQTVALARGRHLYSAGRPSRWALAHISSLLSFVLYTEDHMNVSGPTYYACTAMNMMKMLTAMKITMNIRKYLHRLTAHYSSRSSSLRWDRECCNNNNSHELSYRPDHETFFSVFWEIELHTL